MTDAQKTLDDVFLTMCPTYNMHSEEQSIEGRITAEQHAVLCKAIYSIPAQDAEPTTIASDHVSSDVGRTAGAVPATGAANQSPLTPTGRGLQAALIAGYSRSWVCNAAITSDIEALRRICLEHADWWNNQAWPALKATGVTEKDLPKRAA
jgi:hypothetical protein